MAVFRAGVGKLLLFLGFLPFAVGVHAAFAQAPELTLTQAAAWKQPLAATYLDENIILDAFANSDGQVSYSAAPSSICSIANENELQINGAGSCEVTAIRTGGSAPDAAEEITRTFDIAKAAQAPLTFPPETLPDSLEYRGSVELSVTGGSTDGEASYSVSGGCSVSGRTVTATSGTGECAVDAIKAGDENYEAAATTMTIPLRQRKPTIAWANLSGQPLSIIKLNDFITADAGIELSFTTKTPETCEMSTTDPALLELKSPGTCIVTASSPENDNDLSIEEETRFPVGRLTQTINWTQQQAYAFKDDLAITLTATASSGLPVGYEVNDTEVCAIDTPKTLRIIKAGTCRVRAQVGGNASFEPAADVERSFTISKATQAALQFTSATSLDFNKPLQLTVSGGTTNGVVSFKVVDGTCTVSGDIVTATSGTGSCVVEATMPGGNSFEDATAETTITLRKLSQTIGWAKLSGQALSVIKLTDVATVNSGLALSFTSKTPDVCDLSGTRPASLDLKVSGTCIVTASQAGGDSYSAASMDTQFTVELAPQSINWTQEQEAVFKEDLSITLTATASSGLPVSYEAEGICAVADGKIRMSGAGDCMVLARQPGSLVYAPAAEVQKLFRIAKAPQAPLTFTSATSLNYRASLDLTVSRGGDVSYSRVSGGCTVSGPTVTATSGTGACVVEATMLGGGNFEDVKARTTISLQKLSQAISWGSLSGMALSIIDLKDSISVDSGLAPSFTTTTPNVCVISSSDPTSLVLKGAGTCTVKASYPEDDNYSASSLDTGFLVDRLPQSISWEQDQTAAFGDAPIPLNAIASSKLEVSYELSATAACAITPDNQLQIKGAGLCVVTAKQSGNPVYAPALNVQRSFTIARAKQPEFSFTIPQLAVGQQVTLSASGGSTDGIVSYTVDESSAAFCALVAPAILEGKAAGGCSVTATKRGNDYLDATATASVAVVKGAQKLLRVEASGTLAFPGTVSLSATGGMGDGGVTYHVASGPCTIAGNQLTSTGPGTCRVTAVKAADRSYEAVTSAPLDVVVGASLAANDAEEAARRSMADTAQSMFGFQPHTDRLNTRNGGGRTTAFLPQGTSTNGMIAFSASASQILQAAGKSDMQVMPTSAQRPDQGYDPYLKTPGSVDIWIDGRFIWRNGADSAGGLDQRTFLGETGVDYLVTENLLIGLSVRLDTNDAKLGGAGGDLDTLGWLAGPYVVWEITPGLQADAKLAYGQSRSDISVIDGSDRFDGSYDSSRWMAEAGVRGALDVSPLRIEPGLRAAFYRETAEAYTLSGSGGMVKEQRFSILRVAFDPRVSFVHMTGEGTAISPYLSPQIAAEWQEAKSANEGWDIYGAVEGGLSIATEDFSFSTNLSASGLGGEGAVSYSAGANLTIPLN
jgi:hypothetical protein